MDFLFFLYTEVANGSSASSSEVGLPMVCFVAFISVMALLATLSLMINLITAIFPAEDLEPEEAVDKAIRDAIAQSIPDAKVVSIRSIKNK